MNRKSTDYTLLLVALVILIAVFVSSCGRNSAHVVKDAIGREWRIYGEYQVGDIYYDDYGHKMTIIE